MPTQEMENVIKSVSIRHSRKGRLITEEKVLKERLRVELRRAEDEKAYTMEKYVEVNIHLTLLLDTSNHGLGFLVLYFIIYIV